MRKKIETVLPIEIDRSIDREREIREREREPKKKNLMNHGIKYIGGGSLS